MKKCPQTRKTLAKSVVINLRPSIPQFLRRVGSILVVLNVALGYCSGQIRERNTRCSADEPVRVEDVFRTIDVLGLWSGARCVGPLSSIRKSSVLKELKKYLVGQIATPGWVRRERDFLRSGNIFVIQSSNLAQRSSKAFEYFSNIRVGEIDLELMPDMFVSMIKRSGVSSDTNLIKCAFFLAVIPESLYIQNMEKSELTTHINELRSNLSLLQLARLLYLLWFMENKVD